jgi:hypothetical protein
MTIRKLFYLTLLPLSTFFMVVPVYAGMAGYNPEPDVISIRLGVGNTTDYTAVRYVCDIGDGNPLTGNDTTGDGSLANPYRTWGKAFTGMDTAAAGTAIALCRGGTFLVTSSPNFFNLNSRAENPLTFRDYMPLTGSSRAAPKLVLAATATFLVSLQDSGTADSDEGYAFINLDVSGINVDGQNGIRGFNDVDHVTIDNCYLHHLVMPFSAEVGNNAPSVRYEDEIINDLTFTSVPDGPDTITRATGTWGADIKRGDGIQVTLSNDNNKIYRVHERVSDTVLSISVGKSWEVTNEVETSGVTVKILKTDGMNSNWEIKHTLITHMATGIYSSLNEGSFHDNVVDSSGYRRPTLDHSLYMGSSKNFHVYNNIFSNNNISDGLCKAAVFVMHGVLSGGLIEDNLIYNRSDKVADTCWGIVFDTGYAAYEAFTDFIVRRNTLINVGSVGIGCNACVNVEISDNYIASNRADVSGAANGIRIPDRDFNGDFGNPLSSNILITGNIIEGYGVTASGNSNSSGIKVFSSAETEGTFTVSDNIIDNFYTCISATGSSGATLTVTGNTTTNCGAGGGEQP